MELKRKDEIAKRIIDAEEKIKKEFEIIQVETLSKEEQLTQAKEDMEKAKNVLDQSEEDSDDDRLQLAIEYEAAVKKLKKLEKVNK